MSTLIRPSFHALSAIMLACACMLVAQIANTLLSASLLPVPTALELPRPKPTPPPVEAPPALSAELLARYTGLSLEKDSKPAPVEVSEDAPRTQLRLRLLGTMMARDSGLSMASVHDDAAQRVRTVWVGSTLQDAEIVAITRARVMLLNAGRLEFLDASTAPAPVASMAALPPSPTGATGFGATIRELSPNTYALTRGDVENALGNMPQLFTQARVVPSFTNGASRGFKLFAIRPDSLFSRLGLKNGDALQRVNGYTLDSPTSALEAFNHLRSSSRIEIEIERDGQPVRKTYNIEQ
ncbi:MAG TPA: type II secretion system protein GspC [Myxococcaceae bacterium]|jgi:general secretion pathway protein C